MRCFRSVFGLFVLTGLLFSCSINYPALPKKQLEPSSEIKYIYKTDQKDRRRVLLKLMTRSYEKAEQDPKIIRVSDRDSIRLTRIMQLNEAGLVRSDADKFSAASVYNHGGGILMKNDSSYYHTAYLLFKELYDKGYRTSMTRSLMNDSYSGWQSYLKK